MKRLVFISLIFVSMSGIAFADEGKPLAQSHSKEFEKVKSLEGKWAGTTTEGGKESNVSVTYHLTSGDSAVVETLFPGTDHEMVSVYHDEGGKLAMTHYCMLGNRPNLALSKSSQTEMTLDFAKNNTINPKSEDHMHSLRLVFIDNDTLVQNWSGITNGKEKEPTVLKLSRVK